MPRVVTVLGEIAEQHWGLVTTSEASAAGVDRQQMSRLSSAGVLTRIVKGVYRMAGAPEQEHELTYATWLALGGARTPFTPDTVPPVVAAGVTAAIAHHLGDFFSQGFDFIVPTRRGTRLARTRLRVRSLRPDDVTFVDGLPTLRVENTIADLIEQWTDLSLVTDALRDAVDQGKLTDCSRLDGLLAPLAARRGYPAGDGHAFTTDLLTMAGTETSGAAQ